LPFNIDREYLVSTLQGLIRINSINPSLVSGGPGETEIAAYTASSMKTIGLDVSVHEPEPGRPSVVGILPGQGGRSLMLNAHYDTVGISGMVDPFSGTIDQGRIYGRGAYDMKGSLAACLAAAKAIVDSGIGLGGDLLIAAVADEEYASLGTADLIEHYPVDAAIVTEPTDLQICLAHKGFIWLNVDVYGKAAHGSRFDLGIDANMRMGRFLSELAQLERALRTGDKHPLVGSPSLHAAVLQGGTELSAYAAHCRLQIERRTIPGETESQVIAGIQELIDRLVSADPSFEATVESFFVRDPFEVSPQTRIVETLAETSTAVTGSRPQMVGESPWMDSALLSAAGIETVVMGPSGSGAHAKEEWVDLDSLITLAEILAETALAYSR
jgi:acetylornithine deacetylase